MVDSLRQGGLVVEPAVKVVREFSIHGYVDAEGCVLGQPCSFSSDAFGAPNSLVRAQSDLVRDQTLAHWAEVVAARLDREGYFGPYGVDAFEYEVNGARHLNALSEVNARFTLGWSLGMGELRNQVLQRYATRR
jgi:hypothetical protein